MKDNDEDENLNLEEFISETVDEISYTSESLDSLNQKLKEAVTNEDYELAVKIRDEINKRSK